MIVGIVGHYHVKVSPMTQAYGRYLEYKDDRRKLVHAVEIFDDGSWLVSGGYDVRRREYTNISGEHCGTYLFVLEGDVEGNLFVRAGCRNFVGLSVARRHWARGAVQQPGSTWYKRACRQSLLRVRLMVEMAKAAGLIKRSVKFNSEVDNVRHANSPAHHRRVSHRVAPKRVRGVRHARAA